MRYGLPSAVSLLAFVVSLAATTGLQIPTAKAWEYDSGSRAAAERASSSPSVKATQRAKAAQKARAAERRDWSTAEEPIIGHSPIRRYFVEFRARNAASYGHMYVMYGEVNDRHEIIKSEVAGFFPAGDRRDCVNCSVYYWTIGHVLPVPSEIGASDGDLEEQYVLARFRVWIDAAQYRRLVAYINERKAHKGPWNAFLNNCVTFGRDVAVFLNLNVPFYMRVAPSVVMYPKDVVEALAAANGVHEDQGPLKDAPGKLPIEAAPKAQTVAAKTSAERDAAEKAEKVVAAVPAPSSPKKRLANRRDDSKSDSDTIH